jgi:hypothetical protein
MPINKPSQAIVLLFLVAAAPLAGHGFVDEEIADVTRRLETKPGDVDLLMRRATLHRAHEDYAAAKADLLAVKEDSKRHPEALLRLASLERGQGELAAADSVLARYFSMGGEAPEAYREKARLHTDQKRGKAAAGAWLKYLSLAQHPTADEFIEAAEAINASGDPSAAQLTVQHGLKRYPASIPLHREAAFHQLRLGRKAAVEERFAELRKRYPTLRPRLFHEEGMLWLAGGHPENAHRCFERALASLDQLPATKQSQPGFRSLRAEILKLLKQRTKKIQPTQ